MNDPEDMPPAEPRKVTAARVRLDWASGGGIAIALACIVGGLIMEGGRVGDIGQLTAAMIVLGGTAGAVMVSTPWRVLKGGLRRLGDIFVDSAPPPQAMIEEIIVYATKARKGGLVSLEREADLIEDPFLKKAVILAVDGNDLQEIRKMLELEISIEEETAEEESKVYECAGGYSPTIGIIGAVLGLIQVMKNLANIDEVGHGIAVAFVATVYGVGAANLFFLPAASKIKAKAGEAIRRKELIVDGVSGIVEGMNPKLIRSKLEAYASTGRSPRKRKATAAHGAVADQIPEPL